MILGWRFKRSGRGSTWYCYGTCLLHQLLDAGDKVTLVNRGSAPAPLGARTFDVVIDQVCTGRYVMTSTMAVYDTIALAEAGPSLTELAVDPRTWPIEGATGSYSEGKRQAEAVFAQAPDFDHIAVRSAHVLGGLDFTGRLDHYVKRIRAGEPIAVHPTPLPTSFVHHREIAEFLFWAAGSTITGPVNACSDSELDVIDLCEIIAAQARVRPVYRIAESAAVSPFSFDRYYAMDNSRAGFEFRARSPTGCPRSSPKAWESDVCGRPGDDS